MITETKQYVNDYLKKKFGENFAGKQTWRLVWSPEQIEWRKGLFNDYYGSILIRSFTGTREVKKYTYLRDRWVLERWFPPEVAFNPEIPESCFGNYEPIYVFEDAKGEPLEPSFKSLDFIIKMAERPKKATNQKTLIDEQKQRERKEIFDLAREMGYDGPDDAPLADEIKGLNLKSDVSQFLRS